MHAHVMGWLVPDLKLDEPYFETPRTSRTLKQKPVSSAPFELWGYLQHQPLHLRSFSASAQAREQLGADGAMCAVPNANARPYGI